MKYVLAIACTLNIYTTQSMQKNSSQPSASSSQPSSSHTFSSQTPIKVPSQARIHHTTTGKNARNSSTGPFPVPPRSFS